MKRYYFFRARDFLASTTKLTMSWYIRGRVVAIGIAQPLLVEVSDDVQDGALAARPAEGLRKNDSATPERPAVNSPLPLKHED